ncbi:nucleoid-associated protein YejK [Pseudomonas aeruginosa]|uniref:nucleoid-associated protein YejK n=1 Tax=Pseudomonas aeruginosa TaxID=287 RepID=UPI0030079F1A|nr:nucleoid-associated protein YejK [Pseudomonas aeruginosa]HCF5057285.1 nucleoid-associated protein YejK [Pseudomonas aeruginosa]
MPIRHCIVHFIDKKPDGNPAALHSRDAELEHNEAADNLLADLNDAYNAKATKGWGLFHGQSGAYPLSGWLSEYLDGGQDFVSFSRQAAEHLVRLMEESSLTVGGHFLLAHYQQGMTDYLMLAMLHHRDGVTLTEGLEVAAIKHLDVGQLHLAARINLSEWRNNPKSRQYISFLKKGGRKAFDYFRDFIGCEEGHDAPSETRTLLKAFSDFVESEDLPEAAAREKTDTLVDYANAQARLGQPVTLDELSSLIDEDRPKAFYDYIRNKDYGLAPEIPADKRTLKQFQRFTGRAEGLAITFEAHHLGSTVEYDEDRDMLIIRNIPRQLKDQLAKRKDSQGA